MNAPAVDIVPSRSTAVVTAIARSVRSLPGTLDRRASARTSSDTLRARGLHPPPPVGATGTAEQEALYDLLFRSSAETLLEVARNPLRLGAEIGFFSVLHTWSQKLSLHRMSIVSFPPAAFRSITPTGFAHEKNYFLPKEVLREVFRGKFVDALEQAFRDGRLNLQGDLALLAQPKIFAAWLRPLFRQDWWCT